MIRGRERGFTFVEIMIALTVGAIIIAGMYQAFDLLHKWWSAVGVGSDQRQNARVGLEVFTRDLEMAGYRTTPYDDVGSKGGVAITLAEANAIEFDMQRPATSQQAQDYVSRLVFYHLMTDQKTGRKNLYRQIRTQPGLQSTDELIAEKVSTFTLKYFDKFNNPVNCLEASYPFDTLSDANQAHYVKNVSRPACYCQDLYNGGEHPDSLCSQNIPPGSADRVYDPPAGLEADPLRNIRRISVSLTTIPARSTTLTTAVAPGDSTLTVLSTAEFPSSGRLVVFLADADGVVADKRTVTYSGKSASQFTGVTGITFAAATAGTVVARPMPIGSVPKPYTLTASVIPPNLEAVDKIEARPPPKTPTGLTVIDNRDCTNKLQVRWNHNDYVKEPHIAGYLVFYGPGTFIDVFRDSSLEALANPTVSIMMDDLLITKNDARKTASNTYTVQILAYDSAGNRSERSAPVSANPDTDVTAFGGANDTTVNPRKPAPPSEVTVAAGTVGTDGIGELVISWPAADDATVGYRLYRSTASFVSGQHIDGSVQAVGEATLAAGVTSWTDAGRAACTPYTYAVASVNCDETLVAQYTYNDNSSVSDYAVVTGQWSETSPPPVPTLTAAGQPKTRQIFLSLTNPAEEESNGADFDRTEVYWSTGSTPSLAGSAVTGGTLVPNSDCGTPGVFKNRGSQVIDFDRESAADAALSLAEGYSYSFLAVSYDRCGNVSSSSLVDSTTGFETSVAIPTGTAGCTDAPTGPPPAPTNAIGDLCRTGSFKLEWDYGTEPADFAGFRVWRRKGSDAWAQLTAGPISQRTWTDTGIKAGAEYAYKIEATDCAYEQYLRDGVWPYTDPADTTSNAPRSLEISFNPGALQRYRTEIAANVAHTTAAVSYGDGAIPVNSAAAFAASGTVSIGCYRVSYTGKDSAGFTGCTWLDSSAGYTAPQNTRVYQYDTAGLTARQNFVTSVSDAMTAGDPSTYTLSMYTYHNNVRLWIENTSKDPMKITDMQVAWTSPEKDAANFVLNRVVVGGSPSGTTETTITGNHASGTTFTVGATVAANTGTVSDAVPLLLRFTNSDGTVDRLTDLRGWTLKITLSRSDQPASNTSCPGRAEFAIVVPRGPELAHFTQSAPGVDGIHSHEVIGESGTARDTDVQVSSGIKVSVFGYAVDNSRDVAPHGCGVGWLDFSPIATPDDPSFPALLYAKAPAAAAADIPTMPTPTDNFLMDQYGLVSDLYQVAAMPREAEKVHWYYPLAMDMTGNWDRIPVPEYGSYAYFQNSFDICGYTPAPPQELTLSSQKPGEAVLRWKAPTKYSDGTAIAVDDTLRYFVYCSTSPPAWALCPVVNGLGGAGLDTDGDGVGDGLYGRGFAHIATLTGVTYSYRVTAKNSCVSAGESVPSATVSESQ